MSSDVTKRALSAGFGVGALALLARRASADTPFSSFAFPATGAPTARTLPDRLAEIKNVKDFGAKGDGVRDDAAAIQAAVNSVFSPPPGFTTATTACSGVIFFPPGAYMLKSPISVNSFTDEFNVHFLGTGLSSRIYEQTGGRFSIERNNPGGQGNQGGMGICTVEKLNFLGNGILFNSVSGLTVRDCLFAGQKGLWAYDGVFTPPLVENCVFRGNSDDPHNISLLGMFVLMAPQVVGCNVGLLGGGFVFGGDWENNRVAIWVGSGPSSLVAPAGSVWPGSLQIVVEGLGCENNGVGVFLEGSTICKISGCSFQGHDWGPLPPDGLFGPPAIPSPSGPTLGNRSAIVIQNCSNSVIEACSTGGWYSGPVIDLRAPVNRVVMTAVEAHADENKPVLWSPNPGGYTFIACNQP